MARDNLEVFVENPDGEERCIIVKDYNIKYGYPAKISGPPEDCYPAEGDCIEDIEAVWQDTGEELTLAEWDFYGETIDQAIYDANPKEEGYDD